MMCRKHIWILAAAVLMSYSMNAAAAGPAPDAEDLMEHSETSETSSGTDAGEDVLYNVSFPADIHACLDPGDLSGRGQIFSDRYAVENYGNTDVVIKIKNIDVFYVSSEDIYEFSEEEITDNSSRIKRLNINMVWENEAEQTEKILCVYEGVYDECVLSLEASEYDENGEFVTLRKGSFGCFYFTGTLNSNPNLVWEDGEITAHFDYEIVSTESGEEKEDIKEIPESGEEKEDMEEIPESAADKEEHKSVGGIQETQTGDGPKEDLAETDKTESGTETPGTDAAGKEDEKGLDKTAEPGADIGQDEGTLNDPEQTGTEIDSNTVGDETGKSVPDTEKNGTEQSVPDTEKNGTEQSVPDTEENGTVPDEGTQSAADIEKEGTSKEPENKEHQEGLSGTEAQSSQETVQSEK